MILLDLKLPKIDGLEVLREIRNNHPSRFVPVVMLTSSQQDIDLARSYELGANSYIQKPVDFRRFEEAIRQTVLYWTTWNQVPDASSGYTLD